SGAKSAAPARAAARCEQRRGVAGYAIRVRSGAARHLPLWWRAGRAPDPATASRECAGPSAERATDTEGRKRELWRELDRAARYRRRDARHRLRRRDKARRGGGG